MLTMPKEFDQNEWFVLSVMVLLILAFFIAPKKLPFPLAASVMLLYSFMGVTIDRIIGVKFPVDFYDIMDTRTYDFFDILIYLINYPLFGYFFAYFYYKWKVKGGYRIAYIAGWIGIIIFFEWMAISMNVFHYKRWDLYHSALVYIGIFIIVSFHLELTRRWYNKEYLKH